MAFDEFLADRIRDVLEKTSNINEKKMFGGLCFFLHGNILVGVWKNSLIARLGPDAGAKALHEEYVAPFDVTGKPMKNWILVEPAGIGDDVQLKRWIDQAIRFVKTLPPK